MSPSDTPTDRPGDVRTAGSTDALPVAPELGLSLDAANMPRKSTLVTHRIVWISILAVAVGLVSAWIAQALMLLINLITDLCFYGRFSDVLSARHEPGSVLSPAGTTIGAWVIVMPVIGGLMAGIMARWGSRAIQGHGIPEAMEQILAHESNIPARMTWLKPVSSAFTIGTGGPFGAEGPIISTGGALGSLLGQLLRVTANERKVLLAAGAAAGMAEVFGAPVSSLVLAIELLLFELRPRSLIPVALATVAAVGVRYAAYGAGPVFRMPDVPEPGALALAALVIVGSLVGYASIWVSKAVYFVEDSFAKLPIHWMWWPALGAVFAGFVGWVEPRTLGVGYDNIDALVQGQFGLTMLLTFGTLKFLSWVISLGSGTSGGTLAPLFMIGGSLGSVIGIAINAAVPSAHVDLRIAALVGMAAIFAGSSRALLTAVVFAFETTRQPATLLPLLGGCTAAYLISALLMRNTIMTEKIERRGVHVPTGYTMDYLERVPVGAVCSRNVVTLKASQTLAEVRRWLAEGGPDTRHQGFPIVGEHGHVRGVLTRRTLLDPQWHYTLTLGELATREPVAVTEAHTLREAADHMVAEKIGRLVVVAKDDPHKLVGILTRGDVLAAHAQRLHEARESSRRLHFHDGFKPRPTSSRWFEGAGHGRGSKPH
ncbi:MAG: CBS domain-containing protein [Rhodanobacter sp.]|nr:MAG: CBS domain-containing protein [Rhodanobacter sp.]TAM13260.1 MAG: CBS domain-containing protein [Rhodanobacter sp.]TAM35320.1 MAG: CBS domain-containing protein [Rhodanobacter sp.]